MPSDHRLRRYRTLCGLPNELLYQIISELVALGWKPASYRDVLEPYSLVCQCLRPICQELLFKYYRRLRIHEKESFQTVLSSFEAQPRLGRPVVTLHLSAVRKKSCPPWPMITPNFLVRIIRCLPHLQYLKLRDVQVDDDDKAPLTQSTMLPATNDDRISLKWLSFDTLENNQSSLTAILRIISFFELGELEWYSSFDLKTAPPPGVLPTLHVRRVQHRWFDHKPCLVPFIQSLTSYMSPSHLQSIALQLVDFESIRAFGDLLSGPARNIKRLHILSDPPPIEDRQSWKDPLDAYWPLLRLSACTQLEALYLHIYMRPKPAEVPLCATPAALMSQVSSSLKTVTLYVECSRIKQPLRALSNDRLMKLQAVDKVLTAAGQFPCFQLLKLRLSMGCSSDKDDCVSACVKALPRVHAAGRLKTV